MNQYEIDYKQGYDKANDEWLERIDKMRDEISFKQEIELKGEETSEWNGCIKEILEIIDKYKEK